MPKQEARLGQYLRDVVRHGAALWTGASVTIGLVVLGWLFSGQSWWSNPPLLFYVIAGAVGLAVTQYFVWRSSVNRLSQEVEEANRLRRVAEQQFRQATLTVAHEMRYGPTANYTNEEQFQHAVAHLEGMEARIAAGDFSGAGEVLSFKDPFHDLLRRRFAGGYGFAEYYNRLIALVEAVERHTAERFPED